MDPLSVLRDYTMRGKLNEVKLVGDECLFGDEYRFPRNIETAYRHPSSGLYTLESLLFYAKNFNIKHTEYMLQARNAKLQNVTFTDRKDLQDYLEGKISTSDKIELVAQIPMASISSLPPNPPNLNSNFIGKKREDESMTSILSDSSKRTRLPSDPSAFPTGKASTGSLTNGERTRVPDIELILAREKPITSNEGLLLCHKRVDAFSSVMAMLNRRDEEKKKMDHQNKKGQKGSEGNRDKSSADNPSSKPNAHPSSSSTSKSAKKGEDSSFWKEYMGTDAAEELGIDPNQSFLQDPARAKESAQMKNEGGRGSSAVKEKHKSSSRSSLGKGGERIEGSPIILVPNASLTLLNTFNAKEFLQDGCFVSADMKAKEMQKKPELVAIQRIMGRESSPVTYHVMDKTSSLSKKDWERVVAVFVLGKEWQFKDWPFKDHVEIFAKIMGVYIRFEDSSMDALQTVRQWNVKILSLSKHKRHQDRTVAHQFWDNLESFLRARKSNLKF